LTTGHSQVSQQDFRNFTPKNKAFKELLEQRVIRIFATAADPNKPTSCVQWSLFVDKVGYRNTSRPGFRLRIHYWIGDERKILIGHIFI